MLKSIKNDFERNQTQRNVNIQCFPNISPKSNISFLALQSIFSFETGQKTYFIIDNIAKIYNKDKNRGIKKTNQIDNTQQIY